MTTTNEILNPRQAHILGTIRELGGSAHRQQICAAAHVSPATINRVMESLRERALVASSWTAPPRGPRCQMISITPLGRRALAGDKVRRAILQDPNRVPPPTRSKLEGFYSPPPAPYCRNNGHTHIQSRGVSC